MHKKPLTTNNGIIREFKSGETISVQSGGTGKSYIPVDNIILGNNANEVKTIKYNLNAITEPLSNNDVNNGYSIGSKWYDIKHSVEYTCLDNSSNNAIWVISTNISNVISWDKISDKPTTINGYGITDAYTKTEIDTKINNIDVDVDWNEINDKPTTINGYGITDAYTKTEIDTHTHNEVIHVTQSDKDKWNKIESVYIYYTGIIGDTSINLIHNLNTLNYEVSYFDMTSNTNLLLIATQNINNLIIDDLSPLTTNNQLKIIIHKLNNTEI